MGWCQWWWCQWFCCCYWRWRSVTAHNTPLPSYPRSPLRYGRSTPPTKCWMEFPAFTLVRFMKNHGLLQALNHPQWYTVSGGRFVTKGAVILYTADHHHLIIIMIIITLSSLSIELVSIAALTSTRFWSWSRIVVCPNRSCASNDSLPRTTRRKSAYSFARERRRQGVRVRRRRLHRRHPLRPVKSLTTSSWPATAMSR